MLQRLIQTGVCRVPVTAFRRLYDSWYEISDTRDISLPADWRPTSSHNTAVTYSELSNLPKYLKYKCIKPSDKSTFSSLLLLLPYHLVLPHSHSLLLFFSFSASSSYSYFPLLYALFCYFRDLVLSPALFPAYPNILPNFTAIFPMFYVYLCLSFHLHVNFRFSISI